MTELASLYEMIQCLRIGTRLHIGVLFFGSYGNEKLTLPHEQTIHASPVCEKIKNASARGYERCFLCRNMAIRHAMEAGAVPADAPDGWEYEIAWQYPHMPAVDEQREQQAIAQKLKNGLTCYRDQISPSWRAHFDQLGEEIAYAKEKGIPVNDKTLEELHNIEKKLGEFAVPFPQEI